MSGPLLDAGSGPAPEGTHAGLIRRALAGAAWGYAGSAAMMMMTLCAQVLLARILGPAEFGVFAVSIVVIGFAAFMADSGIGVSLIARKEIGPEDIRFAFTVQLIVGLLATLALVFAAPLIAGALNVPAAEPVLQVLALATFLTAVSAISMSLLKRDFGFKRQSLANVSGYFAGSFLVAIPLALLGFGAMSMAIGWVAQMLVSNFLLWRRYPHPLRPLLRHPGGLSMLGFGGLSTLTVFARFVANNVDRTLVSRFTSPAELAFYAMPQSLVSQPVGRVLGMLQSVAFSLSSRLHGERADGSKPFLATIELSTLLFAPLCAVMVAASDTIVHALYGPSWSPAGPILQVAALGMLFSTYAEIASPFLWGFGRGRADFAGHVATCVLVCLVAYVGAREGVLATAWLVAGAYFLRSAWLTIAAVRMFGIAERSRLWMALVPGAVVGMVVGLAAWFTDIMMMSAQATPIWRLAAIAVVTILSSALSLFCARSLMSSGLRVRADDLLRLLSRRLAAARN